MTPLKRMNRRKFVSTAAMAAAATAIIPGLASGCAKKEPLMKRVFGKTGFEVTTFGLGGQASLQWTPDGVDPVRIILKAFDMGVNYFDTSNLYGPSQLNFGKAFRQLNLVPAGEGYDEALRKSIFLTSKTHLRIAKGDMNIEGVNNWTNGEQGTHTVADLKRSLSQMFGDGNGNYPAGAYVDMMLFHNLNTMQEVDAIYEGIENTTPEMERIGALAALRDYRDGTNLTGLNPGNEKLIRHIGFSGHYDPAVHVYMIQKDKTNLLDAMLVAINANDTHMFNFRHNVLPLCREKNMGVIAMKVFADGALYTKPAGWSNKPEHVVMTVGSPELPSAPLIRYALDVPEVHVAIIGIGHVSDNPSECQLVSNINAAQLLPGSLTEAERKDTEARAWKVKEGKANYFQRVAMALTAPSGLTVVSSSEGGARKISLGWHTAFSAGAALKSYQVLRDGAVAADIPFTPQVSTDPITWSETISDKEKHTYSVKVTDTSGAEAITEAVEV